MKITTKEIAVGETGYKKIAVSTISSSHHIELTPSESGIYDRYVITSILKDIAATVPLEINQMFQKKKEEEEEDDKMKDDDEEEEIKTKGFKKSFKVIVINEADKLTHNAQAALRRTMEQYMKYCRIILIGNSTSNIIQPIQSRCLCMRVPLPTNDKVSAICSKIAKKENVIVPPPVLQNIAIEAKGNLRRAILMLEETVATSNERISSTTKIPKATWQKFIEDIGGNMMEEQSPKRILTIRDQFYLLFTNCIPPTEIMRILVNTIMGRMDHQFEEKTATTLKHKLVATAAEFESRLKQGSRPIFHLEAFVAS
eukprot:CAMPEP_0117430674 /NCGR_PEP_ID=MMETSP0758-20121206/10231_1 /TAXON_ID=63605 /ORGANISM="Percolomonas cosmopolitus, Strain AE-1 (ATCC 50343)" /LENGTH=312 /DNA_ID=CAMNT_0005218965 /DNA_START=135 /DNA_END=1069 /DNA_ORIENTATION=+